MVNSKFFASLFCILYALFYIAGQATGYIELIAISLVMGYIGFFIGFVVDRGSMLFVFSFLSVILLVLLFNYTYPFQRLLFNSLFLFINFLFVYLALTNRLNVKLVLKMVLAGLVSYFIYSFIMSVIVSEPVYVFMDRQLIGFSYNYISGLLVLAFILLFALNKIDNLSKDVRNIFFSVILVCICFMLYGRSGILLSFLVLLVSVQSALRNRGPLKYLVITFIAVCGLIGFVYFYDDIVTLVMESKFKEGIESPRSVMLFEYFNQIDISTLLIGVDLNKIPLIVSFNYNPHNSFLNLHAMYGIFAILFLLAVVFCLSLVLLKDYIIGFLLLIYIGRGMFDTIIFPGVLDFAFYYVLVRMLYTQTVRE